MKARESEISSKKETEMFKVKSKQEAARAQKVRDGARSRQQYNTHANTDNTTTTPHVFQIYPDHCCEAVQKVGIQ